VQALFVMGFTSMAGQILLMREFLVVSYGNELTLGLTLAGWLFWVSAGSVLTGKLISKKEFNSKGLFAFINLALAFILPLSVVAVRYSRRLFATSYGEITGITPMAAGAFFLLIPACLSLGALFSLGCALYRTGAGSVKGIGYVYALEACGAASGGLVTSFLFIKIIDALTIMMFLGLLNLVVALFMLRDRGALRLIPALLVPLFLYGILSGESSRLDNLILEGQWAGHGLVASENSIYGNTAVTRRDGLYSVYTNGLHSFSDPDRMNAELAAHIPLLEHPSPDKVLLIGASPAILEEALKHPVREIDYVELDPKLIDMVSRHLPGGRILRDERIDLITGLDGRRYILFTEKSYDVVALNLAGPCTAQLNRFYTTGFFLRVKEVLRDGGVVSFNLPSNPNYMSEEQLSLYLTLKATLGSVFKYVVITPGERNFFIASDISGYITLEADALAGRLKDRGIRAPFMEGYFLPSELSEERIASFRKRLSDVEGIRVLKNSDFKPIAYYYDMILWSSHFTRGMARIFNYVKPFHIYAAVALLCLGLLLPAFSGPVAKRFPGWHILACVGTTGFAEMTFQIVILLAFQIIYGYVYYKLGIIMTSYMAGLILGSLYVNKRLDKIRDGVGLFKKTQVYVFIYPLILPFVFSVFGGSENETLLAFGSAVVFPALPFIAGAIGGFQFPLANSIYLVSAGAKPAYSGGLTYALDLFGAFVGACVVTAFLIPLAGLVGTCLIAASLNLTGLVLIMIIGKR